MGYEKRQDMSFEKTEDYVEKSFEKVV